MTNKKNGTLYVGVTSNILRRISEHKTSINTGFTQRYKLYLLVYVEQRPMITKAIRREKQIKVGSRTAKIKLIHSINPHRDDLTEKWYQ